MKIKSALFATSSPSLAACPRAVLPEFAFIGRSNVGKSSLLNLLAEKEDLALVSDLPGKTKLINFFTINNTWSLVDLPGYGYAKVSKTDRIEFNTAVRDYLSQRPTLQRVFALIDSRLPPQEMDLKFVHWLGTNEIPFALAFYSSSSPSSGSTTVSRLVSLIMRGAVKGLVCLGVVKDCAIKASSSERPVLVVVDVAKIGGCASVDLAMACLNLAMALRVC